MASGFLNADRERPAGARLTRWLVFLLCAALVLSPEIAGAVPSIAETTGKVFFLKAGGTTWGQVSKGLALGPGDQVRTASGSRATLLFDDGSRVELGPNASFTLQDTSPQSISLKLGLGKLRAWVTKALARRFEVRTPTAVCSVRGTDFDVNVDERGFTSVHMFEGLLSVADQQGNEALIKDGQSVSVSDKGLGAVTGEAGAEAAAERSKERMKREVGLEMSKEEVQAAAAIEAKNAVYQQGKAIIDVNGNRVRIEEYIVRPQPDQFKLVVLNERSDRFDYFYYRGTFNAALPDDLSVALRQLPGCIDSPCGFFLKAFDTGRSNTTDNMLEVATGGHQVDVNNNGVAGDRVEAAFDPGTDQFISVNVPNPGGAGNQPFYQTLFNNNRLTFNGVEHTSWQPSGAGPTGSQFAGDGCETGLPCVQNTAAHITYTNTTVVQFPPSCAPPNCTYTEDGVLHQVIYSENAGGTIWDRFDSYIISDEGTIARTSDFAGVTSGTSYKETLLNWNFQQIVTASEFNGRKIDLAVEPRIFIQSGLIP